MEVISLLIFEATGPHASQVREDTKHVITFHFFLKLFSTDDFTVYSVTVIWYLLYIEEHTVCAASLGE
jgi:hypothetical protein